MSSGLKLLGKDAGHVRAEWRDIYLLIFRSAPRLEQVEQIELEMKALSTRYPQGVAMVLIIEAGCDTPPKEVRDRSKKTLAVTAPFTRIMAMVLEGDGLWASAMRSLLVGATLFLRTPLRQEICRTTSEAAGKVCAALEPAILPAELKVAIAELRIAFPLGR